MRLDQLLCVPKSTAWVLQKMMVFCVSHGTCLTRYEPNRFAEDRDFRHFTGDGQFTELEDLRVRPLSVHQSIIAVNSTSFWSSFQQEFLSMSSEFTFGDNSDKLSIFQFFSEFG